MPEQIPNPPTMQPGARSITGSGNSPDAFGMPMQQLPEFMPAGVSLDPKGPSTVTFYNGAQPAYAGGGVRESKQVKSSPMK